MFQVRHRLLLPSAYRNYCIKRSLNVSVGWGGNNCFTEQLKRDGKIYHL